MRPGLEPGAEASVTVRATEEMSAQFEHLGLVHPVYSTWSMVRHMELASRTVMVRARLAEAGAVAPHRIRPQSGQRRRGQEGSAGGANPPSTLTRVVGSEQPCEGLWSLWSRRFGTAGSTTARSST